MLKSLAKLFDELAKANERRLIVVTGSREFQVKAVEQVVTFYLERLSEEFVGLSWGDAYEHCYHITKNYRHHLGTEAHLVIFSDDSFHPDAFAALSGTIKAGGLMVWVPSREQQERDTDLFIRYVWQHVRGSQEHIVWQEGQLLPLPELPLTAFEETTEFKFGALTFDQQRAVEAIKKVAKGHSYRPLVITADRGRGKSTALALACKAIIDASSGKQRIVICAPNKEAVSICFAHLQALFHHKTLRKAMIKPLLIPDTNRP